MCEVCEVPVPGRVELRLQGPSLHLLLRESHGPARAVGPSVCGMKT